VILPFYVSPSSYVIPDIVVSSVHCKLYAYAKCLVDGMAYNSATQSALEYGRHHCVMPGTLRHPTSQLPVTHFRRTSQQTESSLMAKRLRERQLSSWMVTLSKSPRLKVRQSCLSKQLLKLTSAQLFNAFISGKNRSKRLTSSTLLHLKSFRKRCIQS
jgi:hypothetical protein